VQPGRWLVASKLTPDLIRGNLGILVKQLYRNDVHDAVKRNLLRLFQFVDIPARYHGRVAEICFHFLQDRREPVAIRVFAMSILGKLAVRYPALRGELKMIIEDNLPVAKPAFSSRARKVLHQIKE
jgi:hypothetical protein